jgi:hypothetical protein
MNENQKIALYMVIIILGGSMYFKAFYLVPFLLLTLFMVWLLEKEKGGELYSFLAIATTIGISAYFGFEQEGDIYVAAWLAWVIIIYSYVKYGKF